MNWRAIGLVMLAAVCVSACERRKSAPPSAVVPAVKTIAVKTQSDSQERSLAGVLVAAQQTRLSFAVGGKLLEIPLREGEPFAAGEAIAHLDPLDFERDLIGQRAKLTSATSRLREAEEVFRRQESLAATGAVSRAALERAEASLATALSDHRVAEVGVANAEQNLSRTKLVAPRDGIVTRKLGHQFEEVSPGQPVYEVGSRDSFEAVFLVPELLVSRLRLEAPVSIRLPGLGDRQVSGQIASIGATAEAGSAFRVKARLADSPVGARSGMSASVELSLPGEKPGQKVFAIPLAALAFDKAETGPVVGREAAVFAFEAKDGANEGVVRRKSVPVAGMAGNQVFVSGGLSEGDRIVTAGVVFLRDGQKARLWTRPE